jgi:hypothetical protein
VNPKIDLVGAVRGRKVLLSVEEEEKVVEEGRRVRARRRLRLRMMWRLSRKSALDCGFRLGFGTGLGGKGGGWG